MYNAKISVMQEEVLEIKFGEGKKIGKEIGKEEKRLEVTKKAIIKGFDNETIADKQDFQLNRFNK